MKRFDRTANTVLDAVMHYIREIESMECEVNEKTFAICKASVENSMYEFYEYTIGLRSKVMRSIFILVNSFVAIVWTFITSFKDELSFVRDVISILDYWLQQATGEIVLFLFLIADIGLFLIGMKIVLAVDESKVERYKEAYELLTWDLYINHEKYGLYQKENKDVSTKRANKRVEREKKKNKVASKRVSGKRLLFVISKILNIIELAIPIISLVVCIGSILSLFRFQADEQIAGVLDFSIAALSSAVLLISIIHKKLNDSQKYIFMQIIYVLLMLVGLLIVLVIGIRLNEPSVVGRFLSFMCLGVTLVMEIAEVITHNYNYTENKEMNRIVQGQIEQNEKRK